MNKKMNLEEFLERYSVSPIEDLDLAYTIAKSLALTDDTEKIHQAAEDFINAYYAFMDSLEEIGYEYG